jgi:hypothetical protein
VEKDKSALGGEPKFRQIIRAFCQVLSRGYTDGREKIMGLLLDLHRAFLRKPPLCCVISRKELLPLISSAGYSVISKQHDAMMLLLMTRLSETATPKRRDGILTLVKRCIDVWPDAYPLALMQMLLASQGRGGVGGPKLIKARMDMAFALIQTLAASPEKYPSHEITIDVRYFTISFTLRWF